MSIAPRLIFLKLGGSLITDKQSPRTLRPKLLQKLAAAIQAARHQDPDMQLLIGHGSGSFGHISAQKYGTRQGVSTPTEWQGFAQVWFDANTLNRLVIESLHLAGVPAVSFPPSASAIADGGRLVHWEVTPIQRALMAGLVPVVYGDVVFDLQRGGTISSTEEAFEYLAPLLHPTRVLLAGIEPGVWLDYPNNTRLADELSPASLADMGDSLDGSAAVDVTGGMHSKVLQAFSLINQVPELDVYIFSGQDPEDLRMAFGNHPPGTRLRIDSHTDLD